MAYYPYTPWSMSEPSTMDREKPKDGWWKNTKEAMKKPWKWKAGNKGRKKRPSYTPTTQQEQWRERPFAAFPPIMAQLTPGGFGLERRNSCPSEKLAQQINVYKEGKKKADDFEFPEYEGQRRPRLDSIFPMYDTPSVVADKPGRRNSIDHGTASAAPGGAKPEPTTSTNAGQGGAKPEPTTSTNAGQGGAKPEPTTSTNAGQGSAKPKPVPRSSSFNQPDYAEKEKEREDEEREKEYRARAGARKESLDSNSSNDRSVDRRQRRTGALRELPRLPRRNSFDRGDVQSLPETALHRRRRPTPIPQERGPFEFHYRRPTTNPPRAAPAHNFAYPHWGPPADGLPPLTEEGGSGLPPLTEEGGSDEIKGFDNFKLY